MAEVTYFVVGIDPIQVFRDKDYERYVSAIVYAFFLSYVGYLILPAVGPRFSSPVRAKVFRVSRIP